MFNRRFMAVAALVAATLGAAAQAPTSLKEAYQGDFLIGAAINTAQITGQDSRGDAIIEAQFDTISPENALKWERIHPKPDTYDFTLADQYVAFGEKHHMFIVGHCLVWHNQVPAWVFRDDKGELCRPRNPAEAHARPHCHGCRPLQRPHSELGRGQRSTERRRHPAPVSMAEDHRRGLYCEGLSSTRTKPILRHS